MTFTPYPTVEPESAPVYVAQPSSIKSIGRRIVAVILSFVLFGVLLLSGFTHAATSLAGNSTEASDTLIAIVTVPSVSNNVANSILNDVQSHSTPATASVINTYRNELVVALVATMNDPATQRIIRTDMRSAYADVQHGTGGQVNLTSLVAAFTSSIDTRIPALHVTPASLGANYLWTIKKSSPLGAGLNNAGWIFTLIGVIGGVLVARFLVRRRRWQLLLTFLIIGLPGFVLFGIGRRASAITKSIHYSNSTSKVVVTKVIERVGTAVAHQGVTLIVISLAIIAIWLGVTTLWSKRTTTPNEIGPNSSR